MSNEDFDYLTHGIAEAEELMKHTVYIGALKQVGDNSIDFLQMIADVQETGRVIKPVRARFLTLPTPLAKGHRARDFDGLFYYETKNTHHPTLARVDDGRIRIYFLLRNKVTIPARSFLGSTVENHMQDATDIVANGITQLYLGKIKSYRYVLNYVGRYISREVQETIRKKRSPENKMITKIDKNTDSPLIDSGELLRSISWVVV